MADIQVKTKSAKSIEDCKKEQDALRDELFDLRNKGGKPEEVKALKAKLQSAVEATQAAKAATV